jgi:hypothetical protein
MAPAAARSESVQAKIQERWQGGVAVKAGPSTTKQYVTTWIQKRCERTSTGRHTTGG